MGREKTALRLVVGVGASAGGLEAFKQLLAALPDDAGMAFLLVQHLNPSHKSLLTELLAPCTKMPVTEADQGVALQPNAVYIIPPDASLAVQDGRVELAAAALVRGVRLPVDHLFRSLAQQYGPRAAGVVLSGAGSDGSNGLRELKAAGGLLIAQQPESSLQSGMPRAAIDTGLVDLVLEIDEIPDALERFASLPDDARIGGAAARVGPPNVELESRYLSDQDLERLSALLEAQLGFDLRVYKPSTVERRVLRRMTLSGHDSVNAYIEHLRQQPDEQQTLLRDLLISVTDFFRDPEACRARREMVIDPMVAHAQPGAELRVWVPGCATGEEAYSIAMEMLDAIDESGKRAGAQVFATDIDQDALAVGRSGIYPPSIAERMSPQRLERYFTPLDGRGYQVRPQLRDVVSFAAHDLTKDPPFSRMNLVSCRNVLIYLTAEAQKQVLKVLHFALEPDGVLMLGTAESPGSQKELFATLSKKQRLYRKVGASRAIALTRSRFAWERSMPVATTGTSLPSARPPSGTELARQDVLDAWVAPTVIVSQENSVLFVHGDVGPYLRIPQGDSPRFELNALLRPEIATRARGALYKCRRSKEAVSVLSSPDDRPDGRVRITARPSPSMGEDAVMLTFEHTAEPAAMEAPERVDSPAEDVIIEQLELELQATREDLRNTVEELETSNEELRSSNEESMSMNEELQSANEELEATTEELRSLNEELTTVNSQLREKVEQLEQAHDDLNNFISSTKVVTIFLDEQLRIKRFTPAAKEQLRIDQADMGRSIVDVARELLQHELEHEAAEVLKNLSARGRDIHTRDGRWFSREVLPYRTESQRIEGVVVTFVDVTDLKSATERLRLREQQQSVIARLGLQALRGKDLDAFLDQAVREVQQTLGTELCKVLELQPGGEKLLLRAGVGWQAGLVGSAWVSSGADSQAGYTLLSSEPVLVEDLPREERFSGPHLLTDHHVVSGLSCVIQGSDTPYGVLGAHTQRRRSFGPEDANFLQAVAGVLASAITRAQTRKRLALELDVARRIAEHGELEVMWAQVMDCFAEHLGACVGELWWPADDGRQLKRAMMHVVPPQQVPRTREALMQSTLAVGEGLVGRVFQTGRAHWHTNLSALDTRSRREGAESLGLVSGVGIPISRGSKVLGVISLSSSQRLVADDVFLRSLEGIGRALGEQVARTESEKRARLLAAITQSSLDAILCHDQAGVVTEWLPGAERLFGYSAGEMIGQSLDQIIPAESLEELRSVHERVVRGEVVAPYETRCTCKGGRELEVSVRSSPILDARGEVAGVSSTVRDITRQKETERRLVEADRQKDEFLAMLGHELRNPLAAIRSASELLELAAEGDPDLQRTQAVLERQTGHMAKLLDGLLDVSRIIRGKIHLEPEVVDLRKACRESLADMQERLVDGRLEVRSDLPEEPVWIEADRVRLAQILANLLSNAVKYTPDGGRIELSVRREDDGMAVLRVRDSGMGIEPELLPHIFEVFRQSRQSLDRSRGGLGLGLALVKSLAELHDGRVEAHSDGVGHGAEFVVRLPLTDQVGVTTPMRPRGPSDALDILVIEDNTDAAEMLQRLLEVQGHRVSLAACGEEGIEMARAHRPDVVLCDLGLPDGLSGFDVVRRLRAEPELRDLRVVALSGYGRPEDRARGAEAGFDDHLTKPVELRQLRAVLANGSGPAT